MHSLSQPIREINSNLESLRDFVDVLGTYLSKKTQESVEIHAPALELLLVATDRIRVVNEQMGDRFLKSFPEEKMAELRAKYPEVVSATVTQGEDSSNIRIEFPVSEPYDISTGLQELVKAQGRTKMLYSSSLMNLTSNVELFFSQLLHQYFNLHPDAIGTKEKLFSFDDLSKFDTLADARVHYISSKIEDLLRGSLADWFSFARNTIKLSMGYLKDDQEALEETFQRRNVVVHNGGIANSIYIAKVSAHLRKEVKVGSDLTPDRKYLSDSIDLWEKTCILIAAELWKQLASEDTDRAKVLAEISYNHLLAKRWHISAALSTFLTRDKQMPESILTSAQLNYWQCQKRLGRWDSIRTEVESADYSAKSVRYQLGHLALLERKDEFYNLLPRALQSGDLTENDLREYPIFEEMRSDQRFEQYQEKRVAKRARRRKKAIPKSTQGDA
jgi:hypothetical protein